MEAERLKVLIRILEKAMTRRQSALQKKADQKLIAQYRAELLKLSSDESKETTLGKK